MSRAMWGSLPSRTQGWIRSNVAPSHPIMNTRLIELLLCNLSGVSGPTAAATVLLSSENGGRYETTGEGVVAVWGRTAPASQVWPPCGGSRVWVRGALAPVGGRSAQDRAEGVDA